MLIPPNSLVLVPMFSFKHDISTSFSALNRPFRSASGWLMSHLVAAKVAFSIFDICRSSLRKAAWAPKESNKCDSSTMIHSWGNYELLNSSVFWYWILTIVIYEPEYMSGWMLKMRSNMTRNTRFVECKWWGSDQPKSVAWQNRIFGVSASLLNGTRWSRWVSCAAWYNSSLASHPRKLDCLILTW